jgi:hypothetical protein
LFHSTLIARFEIFIAITAVCLVPLANKVFAMRAQMQAAALGRFPSSQKTPSHLAALVALEPQKADA